MMFVVECLDKPNSLPLRLATRPTHLAYLDRFQAQIVIAGPLLDASGNPMGSLLIFDVQSREELDAIVAGDPYAAVGLFASVRVTPFRKTLPA
jgi:uncharacterized protein